MTLAGFGSQLLQLAIALALAPLLVGWVNQCRAWLQNRSAPSLLLPYRTIRKLFLKDAVVAEGASPIFRITPYIVFAAMCCAAAIVPSLATDLPFARAADAIALVGLFALARVFIALAAMDIGTAFGSLGARQEPVTYWFTVGDKAVLNTTQKRLVDLRYGLTGRIPDGMLFRVSSIDQDPPRAYQMQNQFINQLLQTVPPADRKRLSGLGVS